MGNDGGSIPTRRELVKEAARNPSATEIKESLQEQQGYFWTTDPLSQRPLAKPIVSDQLGRLFNKDSVIEFLLPAQEADDNKHSEQEEFLRGTITGLKDVVEVKFEVDSASKKWVCPVTRQELGPGSKAAYIVPCGHAFSGAAIKEVPEQLCLQCNEPFAPNDVISILPTSETEVSRLTLRAQSLHERGLTHSLKKVSGSGGKKRKQNGTPDTANHHKETTKTAAAEHKSDEVSSKPQSKDSTPQPPSSTKSTSSSNGIKNAATASLTAKVLQEQEERNKRRKIAPNENLNSLFSHSDAASAHKKATTSDFMTRGYAIPSKR